MILSGRFGQIIVDETGNDYIICALYSIYESGIANIASNKEFCFFILTKIYHNLDRKEHPVLRQKDTTKEEKADIISYFTHLYGKLDEASHALYKKSMALLGLINTNTGETLVFPNKEEFSILAAKVIKGFNVSEIKAGNSTFKEYAYIEIIVNDANVIRHIADSLVVEY